MTPPADVVIIGGGIVGLATALALAEGRMRVLVFDEPRAGSASRAAAGMLAPSVEGLPAHVLPLAIAARDLYPEFLSRLLARTHVPVVLDRRGILEVASSGSELDLLAGRAAANAQVLDARALGRLEPGFSGHAGAVLHPHDGAVDNVALMQALRVAVEKDPRIECVAACVHAVAFGGEGAVVSAASPHRVSCGRVVLAPGAWTTAIAGLPRTVPVRPVRGQLLLLDSSSVCHVTYGAGGYLVPRRPGLLIGATSEESGFECRITDVARAALLSIARQANPALGSARVLDHWAGLRPMSPDSLPVLGEDPEVHALVYGCGLSRNGILFAPWVARQLCALIRHGQAPTDLARFSVSRFDEKQ